MTGPLESREIITSQHEAALRTAARDTAHGSVTMPYRANLLGNIEQALKGLQGYGIMALELIQNADDAGAASLTFDAREEALVVHNDGSFSSCGLRELECTWIRSGDPSGLRRPCNFHAIAEMGSRSKLHAVEQIGRFGIGFVSVYQITDMPIVRSSGVQLRLNPQTQEVVKSDIAHTSGTEFVLPWASAESDVRNGLNASPTPVDVADKVAAEIEHVLQGSLLFLRHVRRVELRRNGILVEAVEIERSGEDVTLRFQPTQSRQCWLIVSRKADNILADYRLFERFEALTRLERSTLVSVALPLNIDKFEGSLYAYLPTRQSTLMPVHVNADFFPHASRQAIVLEGEQHDRYWNEALIETAASAVADNFVRIRDLLGPTRLWTLAEAAFQRKAEPAFKAFWDRLGKAATDVPSVWTTSREWRTSKEAVLPPEAMTTDDQAAVADLGLPLIHSELRRHWTVLSSIGVQRLRLASLVAALEARGSEAAAGGGEPIRRLWSAIDLLIDASSDRTDLPGVLTKLRTIPFMLDLDDRPISPTDAKRLPTTLSATSLRRILPTRRIVHPNVLSFPHLSALVAEYLLEDFASDLAAEITDEASAFTTIGRHEGDARRFYTLLTSFPTDRGTGLVGNILADVPFLRTGTGFVSPSRGQLPGDFRDPIGHFQIIETRSFVEGMWDLARTVLDVEVLTFRNYVVEHLEGIIGAGVTRQQYGALLTEIVNHRSQLDEDGTLEALGRIPFVRTRAGEYARPDQVYFWSAAFMLILGDDPVRWVDESWLPRDLRSRASDLFARLGMPFRVAAEHIVERIATVADTRNLDDIAARTAPIIRHVLEHWTRFDDRERQVLGRLREVSFLSAIVDGARKEGTTYSPRSVYRAGRATGFASQVAIVEMTALRQSNAVVTEFLDLIEMPAEPPTDRIVAHLEHCISFGTPVNDLTYQMLSERLERSDDAAVIDRLAGTNFIYVPDFGFIGAGEVFWNQPAFGGRWHAASQRMRQREQLYRRLGVVDSPEPRHFADLALQIASCGSPSSADNFIHGQCLAALAEGLEREDAGAAEAIDTLVGKKAFLNLRGDPTWTVDAIWLDSEQLAASFGSVLDERLIRLPDVSRSAAIRLLHRLEVPALSDVARFSLAAKPDGRTAEDATSLLQSRADLILWLAPNRATRHAMRAILQRLEIRFSDRLLVQAEIDAFDPPVRSPATSAPAYLDDETGLLHLRSATGRVDWAAAFRSLFAAVERFCPVADIPPLCLTAAYITSLDDWADAEQALRASDFKAPIDDDHGIEAGRELEDELMEYAEEHGEGGATFDDRHTVENASDRDAVAGAKLSLDSCALRDGRGSDLERNGRAGLQDPAEQRSKSELGQTREERPRGVGAGQISGNFQGAHGAGDYGPEDDDYRSATGRGKFQAGLGEPVTIERGARTASERTSAAAEGPPQSNAAPLEASRNRSSATSAERQVRRSRMLSYVSRSGPRGDGEAASASTSEDITALIDAAAIKAALSYERSRGWNPEQQPHFNPGFDIVSKSSGDRRLIEVKGLESEWTERGIKLSHVQFAMAREHPDDFWIYVVEHARDLERQRVTAIGNPFSKVEEYWFDHNWRDSSEERAASRDIHLRVGLKVRHHFWGKGVVVEIQSRGIIPFVVVDFGALEGRRAVPFNSSLKILD